MNEKGVLRRFRHEFYKRVDRLCRKDVAVNIKLACVEVMLEALAEDDNIPNTDPIYAARPNRPTARLRKNNKIGDVL